MHAPVAYKGCITMLTEEEADNEYRKPSSALRREMGTQVINDEDMAGKTDVPIPADPVVLSQYHGKLSFGDLCCGAGGASRAALDAGFKVQLGIDSNAPAMESYRRNFEQLGTTCLKTTLARFLTQIKTDRGFRVDVVHASAPCQPWCPLSMHNHYTGDSPQNVANKRALYECLEVLEAMKPRVITMEQTRGTVNYHQITFLSVIQRILAMGYSVRWEVIDFLSHELPQQRRRLIVIAAA